MRGDIRVQNVIEAFCELTYVQHSPVAIYHHFIDYIHLLCFAPVNVVLQAGVMRAFSVPQFAAPFQPETSNLLDRYEDLECRVTLAVYRLHESAQLRPGTLEALVSGIRRRSPAAGGFLRAALEKGVFYEGDGTRSSLLPHAIRLDPDLLSNAMMQFQDRLAPVWEQYLSHEDLLSRLRQPLRLDASSLRPIQARATIKYVPTSAYTRQVEIGGSSFPLPYEVYRIGSSISADSNSGAAGRPVFEDLSLFGGHLQVSLEGGRHAVTIPVHVGGTAWLAVSMFPKPANAAWREVLRFYSLALPRLAEEIRTLTQESFLEAVRITFRTHAPWSTGRPWNLEHLNEMLFQLSMLFPFPVVCIEAVSMDQADVSPDGHPIRVLVQQTSRPLPAELEYRPLSPRTVRDECMDELRIYEQQWVKQTDALVAGVYKIGHQLGHAVAPLRLMLDDVQRLLLEYRRTHQEALLDELGHAVLQAGLIGDKASRKSLILDMLATATLENTARQTFLKPGKQAWRTDTPFVLDLEAVAGFAGEPWSFVGGSRVNLLCQGFLSLEINPWIHDTSYRAWRPSDKFYMEFFHEVILNAGRHGKVRADRREVNVNGYVEHLTEGGDPQAILTFENERRHPHIDLSIPHDGCWHEWPTGKGAPSGGLYFLTMFAERTELGRIYTRLRNDASRELFAVGLWFRGMNLT